MQYHTAEQLDVVMYHIPCHLVAACHPVIVIDGFLAVYLNEVVACIGCHVAIALGGGHFYRLALRKTTCGGFYYCKRLRQQLHQDDFVLLLDLFLQIVNLLIDFFAFVYLQCLYRGAQLGNLCFLGGYGRGNLVHQRL